MILYKIYYLKECRYDHGAIVVDYKLRSRLEINLKVLEQQQGSCIRFHGFSELDHRSTKFEMPMALIDPLVNCADPE